MTLIPSVPTGRFRAEQLLRPRSVVVLGAETPLGARCLANLRGAGFGGTVLALDGGAQACADVAALPAAPDLAVLAGPAADAPDALRALGALGTVAAVALGPVPDLLAAGRAAGARVLGPNSYGVSVPGIGLDASTAHLRAKPGRVALVSQSAALCRSVLDWAEPNGVGFSHIVGTGGNADIGFGLVLDWLSRDPGTGAILLDLRRIKDARAFLSAARAAARLRPVVCLRAGGRLLDGTGQGDEVFAAALRRAGVLQVGSLGDLLAAAETLTRARPARTVAVAIVTNSTRLGRLAADAAARLDVPRAELPEAARAALSLALPPQAGGDGPLRVGRDAPATRLAEVARMLSAVPAVGGVVAVMAPSDPAGDAAGIEALAAALPVLRVPLLACVPGETTGAAHRRRLAEAGVPGFATPEEAMLAFAQLVQVRRARAAARELPPSTVLRLAPDRDAVRRLFAAARAAGRGGLLQDEALAALAAYGMPVVPGRVAVGVEDAAERGGVALDLPDAAAVRRAAELLDARRARHPPGALAAGFLVQRQVGRARELRVRVAEDPVFGPALSFGGGGSAADLLGGAVYDLPPLNLALARGLIGRAVAGRALAELHDQPAADADAVADALVRVSQLVVDFPEIAALDINPLFAGADGVLAADAWIALRRVGEGAKLAIAPYPAELSELWELGGERLLVRPIRPEDAEAHAALFARLTPEDIRYRFFSSLRALPAEQVARMTQVDYDREMAFVAVDEASGDTVGVCRLVREPYTDLGEFAVVVEGRVKGRGLATGLMRKLIGWARGQGMTVITGQVLAENRPMLAFVRKQGFAVRRLPDDPEVMEATLTLAPFASAPG